MRRRSGGGGEVLFQESDAHPLGAAHRPQRGRRPGLALDHLGEQGQPHGDDFAVLGQPGDGLIQELALLLA